MSDKKLSITLGAVVATILSTSYLSFINFLCCAGIIVSGLLTVWHYTSTTETTVPPGRGAMMGLTAAAIGSFVAIFLNFALVKLGVRADLATSQFVLNRFGDKMPPEQVEQMRAQMEQPVLFVSFFLKGLIGVVVGAVFGAIGGAIGGAIFKKGKDVEEVG